MDSLDHEYFAKVEVTFQLFVPPVTKTKLRAIVLVGMKMMKCPPLPIHQVISLLVESPRETICVSILVLRTQVASFLP